MFSVLKKVLGVLCILFGLFALFTPLTPGAWLILVGLELMGLGFLIPKKMRAYWEKTKTLLKKRFGRKTETVEKSGNTEKDAAE